MKFLLRYINSKVEGDHFLKSKGDACFFTTILSGYIGYSWYDF